MRPWRRWLLPAAFFAALSFYLLRRAIFGPPGTVIGAPDGDLIFQHLAWRQFGFGELRRGRLALWNPHIFGGAPFFGGFQSALLYPPNWVHLFLSLAAGVNVYVWLHVALAGFLAALWCRGRGSSLAASTLGGFIFALSGPFYFHVYAGHLPQLGSMAWAPAVLLAVDALAAGGGPPWLLFGMAAVALQLAAGSPQHVYYTAIGAFVYALARRPGSWKKALPGLIVLYAGAFFLSAVQSWTGLQAVLECVRGGGTPRAFAGMFSLPPENLLTAAAPYFLGDERLIPYIGRTYLWESCLYVGTAALTLAAVGLGAGRGRARLWAPLALLPLLALGSHTPLFSWCCKLLPGFALFRGTAKFGWLFALFLGAAAAEGLDALRQRPIARAWPLGVLALSILFFAGAWALRTPSGVRQLWRPLMNVIAASKESPLSAKIYEEPELVALTARFASRQFAGCGALFAACAGLLWLSRRRRAALPGFALLAFLELAAFAGGISVTASSTPLPSAPWFEALERKKPEERVFDAGVTSADMGMRLGLDGVWGYDPFVLRRYAEFIAASQGAPPREASQYAHFESKPAIYRLLRVPPDAMPRLSLFHQVQVIPDKDRLLKAVLAPDFDPTRTVLLETPPRPAPAPAGDGSVRLLGSVPGRLDVEADLSAPAVLLITDAYSSGWRARPLTPDAQSEFEVLPADYALQAVPLAAGRHQLRLEYKPAAFTWGAWVSGISAAGYLAAVVSAL